LSINPKTLENTMKKLTIFLTFLLCACTPKGQPLPTSAGQDTQPIVQTQSGKLRGAAQDGIAVFKGIPFAAPPVGAFRWRPPQPVAAWKGVRDALEFGPDCAQAGWGGTPGSITKGSSEDCLYLNLWAPVGAKVKAKLPVMVWIHGGGFVGGSGSNPETFGDQFTKQGVVLVTINYRLGRLGFFAHPALSQAYPDEPKGNYGYMDQIAALQWVQDNVAAFGGDPKNVTIFGFSAGGVSVHSLLTIPAAKGLFHKAICQSSGGRDGVLTGRPIDQENADPFYPVSAETTGLNFAKKHGIEGSDAAALTKLRALKVEAIVDGGQETDGQGGPRIYAGPILDGRLVVETAESAYKAGRQVKVPLMIGSNSAEIGGSFVNAAGSKEALFALFGPLENEATAAYDPDGHKEFAEVITKFNTDWVWSEPGRMTAKAFTTKDIPVYMYQFSYVPTAMQERMKYGAGHGSEVAYVFNHLGNRRGITATSPEDEKVGQIMHSYWANFAKSGNPNGSDLPLWPVYSLQKGEIMDIETSGKPVGKPDPRKARLDVIEKSDKMRTRLQSRGI
jgi:para-nitrobenzyl esterase